MFHERVKVIEHRADGTDAVIDEQVWASPYGNTRWPSVFVRSSYRELVGEEVDVDISGSEWRLDSPDGRYSWVATWESGI